MILKKPYVVLIKYFRLIHAIVAVFIAYCLYKTNILLRFFNDYITSGTSVVGQNLKSHLYTNLMFVIPFIILIFSILLLWLMIKKKKKFRFYLYNSLVYLFVFILIIYVNSYLGIMESRLVDIVGVRALRDILIIAIVLQSISLMIIFIRAIGLDIKSFEFMTDLQGLELSEEDQEEYEIDFNIDSNERRRKRKRKLRYLKYTYKENKLFINIVIAIMVGVLCIIIYNKVGIYTKVNKQGSILSTEYYNLGVVDTYLVNTSYKGIKITDDYLVVINLKIRSKGLQNKLITGNYKLQIGKDKYSTTNKYDKYLIDIGKVYNNDFITSNYSNYLLVYEIPKDKIKSSMQLVYLEHSKSVKIKLKPTIYETDEKNYKLGDNISITDNDEVVVNNYEIKDSYTINYDYCIKDKCYNSIQYIVPTLNTNYDKAILKLNGTSTHKEGSSYTNFNNLLTSTGIIEYKIGDSIKTASLTRVTNLKKEEKDIYYYEINKEVMNAESIKLIFSTRKCKYSYILK